MSLIDNYNMIKLDDNCLNLYEKNCYLCLEKINYYYKFDCGCHNYFHNECIKDKLIDRCLICKKKIISLNNVNYDLYYSDLFLVKIKKILNVFFVIFKLCPNFITFGLFIMINIFLTFGLVIPSVALNIGYNFIKKYFFELMDYCFLLLLLFVVLFIIY